MHVSVLVSVAMLGCACPALCVSASTVPSQVACLVAPHLIFALFISIGVGELFKV